MKGFLEYFSPGDFEFSFNSNVSQITKVYSITQIPLFDYKKRAERKERILEYFNQETPLLSEKIKEIFQITPNVLSYSGVDYSDGRYKFYIPLCYMPIKEALSFIQRSRNILGINGTYTLEDNFLSFDLAGFDVSRNGVNFKIYELVKDNLKNESLPNFIQPSEISDVYYLKSFGGRRKKLLRFKNHKDLGEFGGVFNLSLVDKLENQIQGYYNLKRKVRYYCYEGEKKEIYFI